MGPSDLRRSVLLVLLDYFSVQDPRSPPRFPIQMEVGTEVVHTLYSRATRRPRQFCHSRSITLCTCSTQ